MSTFAKAAMDNIAKMARKQHLDEARQLYLDGWRGQVVIENSDGGKRYVDLRNHDKQKASTMKLAKSIGKRIKQRRLDLELDADTVCKSTKLSRGHLYTLENGSSAPNSATLVKLSKALSVSADWLLGLEK